MDKALMPLCHNRFMIKRHNGMALACTYAKTSKFL